MGGMKGVVVGGVFFMRYLGKTFMRGMGFWVEDLGVVVFG